MTCMASIHRNIPTCAVKPAFSGSVRSECAGYYVSCVSEARKCGTCGEVMFKCEKITEWDCCCLYSFNLSATESIKGFQILKIST